MKLIKLKTDLKKNHLLQLQEQGIIEVRENKTFLKNDKLGKLEAFCFEGIDNIQMHYYRFKVNKPIVIQFQNAKDLIGLGFNLNGSITKLSVSDTIENQFELFYGGEHEFITSIPPNQVIELIIITLHKSLWLKMTEAKALEFPFFQFRLLQQKESDLILQKMQRIADMRTFQAFSFAFELLGQKFNQMDHNFSRNPIYPALNYMKININEKFPGIQELSDCCKMSTSTFKRQFHLQTGMTALEYFMANKIQLSQQMLMNGKENISEISYSLGFANSSYFIKVFKKQVGLTPKAFKEICDPKTT